MAFIDVKMDFFTDLFLQMTVSVKTSKDHTAIPTIGSIVTVRVSIDIIACKKSFQTLFELFWQRFGSDTHDHSFRNYVFVHKIHKKIQDMGRNKNISTDFQPSKKLVPSKN